MNLKIIKSKSNSYKIISTSNCKHPALIELANLLRDNNKSSDIKVGIFSVTSAEFSLHKSVYSYISGRKERMNKRDYNRWVKGTRQIKQQPKPVWKSEDAESDIQNILEETT